MNFLTVFEHRIGSLFGATDQGLTAPFSFKKLAKKAAREMEAETYVIDGADTAPALYTILVSTEDDLAMRPLYLQLTGETARFIEGQARDKGYVFVAPPLVRFMADPSLRSGHFSVFAENVDVRTLSRLREEEAKFMGAGASLAGGLGGAAFEQLPHADARRPQQSAVGVASSTPADGVDAGLDVLPQQAVIDAEEAALSADAHHGGHNNVPLVNARSRANAQAPKPPRSATPGAVAAAVPGKLTTPDAAPAIPPTSDSADSVPRAAPRSVAQHEPSTVRVAQPVSAPKVQPTTCLLIDRQSGRTFTVSAPRTIIGRERTPGGVVLHDPNISRNHAELSFDGQSWHIRDLNSTNGTLVNDVDVDECPLRDGDLITLGLVNLEFREN